MKTHSSPIYRNIVAPLTGPYDGKHCDYCQAGDHGRCWRSVCKCPHPGWTRDVNAQVPHGCAGGFSKETKNYEYELGDKRPSDKGQKKGVGRAKGRMREGLSSGFF